MLEPISITAINSISPLGISLDEIWKNYLNDEHCIKAIDMNGQKQFIASLPSNAKAEIEKLKESDSKYRKLDNSVLYAIYA